MREELIAALNAARGQLRVDSVETLNAELKKLNDVVYKFSAAVQSSTQQQQQPQGNTEQTQSQDQTQSQTENNDDKKNKN